MAEHLVPLIETRTTSRKAWDALAAPFRSRSMARRTQLTRQLAAIRMAEGESLLSYAGRSKALHNELWEVGRPMSSDVLCVNFLRGLPAT